MTGKLLIFLLPVVLCQIPIPRRPLGFVYNWGNASAPVNFDVYMGPLCPDSAAVLPTITGVADHYGPNNVRLRIHLFPLPYHRNAFVIAMGTHAVDAITKGNMTYYWTQQVYQNIVKFSDVSLSQDQLVLKMTDLAKSMGISQVDFMKLATSPSVNMDCRIEWKYACSRGVTGTPTFMLNDVVVSADLTWTVADWSKVIDPLLQPQLSLRTDCKAGTTRCEYLPGKIECCTPGENCIPNVGCRCFGSNARAPCL